MNSIFYDKIDCTPLLKYLNNRIPNFHSRQIETFYLQTASINIFNKSFVP